MSTHYEKLLPSLRRRWLREAADRAEWNVPEGPIGDLVRQQRHRARVSNTRTNWTLAALIGTILAGIAFFVGGPLWKIYADGTRLALEATMATAVEDAVKLNASREDLRKRLVAAIRQPGAWFTRAELPELVSGSVAYVGHASLADGTLVLYGDDGTVLRLAPGAEAFTRAALPDGVSGTVI